MKTFDQPNPPKKSQDHLAAFLEFGSELEGHLCFSGVVRINGKFKGTLESHDGVIVGAPAHIEGKLRVGSANIGGHVKGDIHARERIELQSTAIVEGLLSAPAILVHEGAQILGELRIQRTQPQSH
jgi:cytoskeletal protein CcmA (bactofilin family)